MKTYLYKVTLKHDKGTVSIQATGSNKAEAEKTVLDYEKAPQSAIVKTEKIQEIK